MEFRRADEDAVGKENVFSPCRSQLGPQSFIFDDFEAAERTANQVSDAAGLPWTVIGASSRRGRLSSTHDIPGSRRILAGRRRRLKVHDNLQAPAPAGLATMDGGGRSIEEFPAWEWQ
ncbi:UDP-3-O-acylglucosamine N-acyltransferase [Striga asiatica]|uniref:UDP-3-O-acylglucosamine N-acyltransferase n=1 Tax=Striga asiatica TaxID=4170 RepID=A0A5A7Q5X6_STRAF|nr:UDP-3-O-acylglucosamine N-acyltransferase [Striga asiatica]